VETSWSRRSALRLSLFLDEKLVLVATSTGVQCLGRQDLSSAGQTGAAMPACEAIPPRSRLLTNATRTAQYKTLAYDRRFHQRSVPAGCSVCRSEKKFMKLVERRPILNSGVRFEWLFPSKAEMATTLDPVLSRKFSRLTETASMISCRVLGC
jgi:hypothetical protein